MQSRGAHYSKAFRKAGIAWGKGDIQKAITILEEGLALAMAHGDTDVILILQQDLERYRCMATEAETNRSGER